MKEDKNLKISVFGIKIALVAMALSVVSSAIQIFLSTYTNEQIRIIASWISGVILLTMGAILLALVLKIKEP